MKLRTQVPLSEYTTLKVGGLAEYFVEASSEEELIEAVSYAKEKNLRFFILGGGSNILAPDVGFSGLVIKNAITGSTYAVDDVAVTCVVKSGEIFDEVVATTVERRYWGMENLSHIPGTMGATPVQNVGAYGVEMGDLIDSVRVLNTETMAFETLGKSACCFRYRDSIFKHAEGKKYIVTEVTLVLSLIPHPRLHYNDLATYFSERIPTQKEIRDGVIEIRSKKFPDWTKVGTAGSFFKNPIISREKYDRLCAIYPELPGNVVAGGDVKVPIGYVFDKILGLKGHARGGLATHENQALVLIHTGGATAQEIDQFATEMSAKVKDTLDIDIEREVTTLN